MALKSNIKRNPSYVESIDDDYLSTSLPPSPPPPQPTSSSSTANETSTQKPGIIFHRKIFSADGFGNSAPPSTPSFAYSSNRSNTFDHSSPPNYYQLALQQEEENRHRQDLFSLIYSSSSPTSTSILLPPIAPPNHPPPSIPTTTNSTETTTFLETYFNNQQQKQPNQQKLRIDNSVILNNNLRPPSFKHLRSVSTDASFESRFSSTQRNFQESEERGNSEEEFISDNTDKIDLSYCEDSFNDISIDLNNFLDNQIERMKPPLEMAKEKRKLVVLNDLEKSSKDFSLSVDENFSPNDFKTSIPSTSTSTSSIPNSPRSKSAPPKQPKQELPQTKNGKHLKIDEEGSNSHELSLFFCSPTVSNSFDMSMDLMNTSEMNNDNFDDDNDYADGEEEEEEEEEIKNDNDYVNLSGPSSFSHLRNSEMKKTAVPSSSKPVNIFTFETEADVANIESKNNNNILENNIQSRPLPPIPNADEDQIPEEPEDSAPEFEIPEPEYACVEGDVGYETIHHQRSISDHVLSYNQIDEKMKTIDFLKKSNSDRSERRSTRKKPTHLSEQLQSSEEDEHRKLSDISEHRKTISCSTPSFLLQPSIDINEGGNNDDETDDGRKRSITTDSISSPPKPSMIATIKQQQIIPSGSKTIKNLPTRKTSDQQFSSSVRLRDCSKSVSTLGSGEQKQRYEKDKKNGSNIFGGILSLRNRKKMKENRSLGNIYPGYNNPNSTTNPSPNQGYPYKADVLTMPDALANVFSKNGKQSESGSEGIRTPGTGTGNHFFDETIPLPALKKPKWEDLDLWDNEPGSWSNCNSDVQLSASDKKRQNIIYELYMTEKNHVKVLVFLQQAYMVGLRQYNQASPFITEEQLDKLIPDVLDSLLDFHLNLLRRLKKKKDENAIIETVSDIVEEEFGNGLFTTAAIRAYTIFCLSRDESCQIYAELMEKNPKFKKFFDHYEMQPAFKQHNFKSCFLLIAQRLTKYNLLFDSILKYDPIPQKAQSQRALTAVREFARRVDSELKKADINRQWDQLKSLLDKKSRGKILNRDFTYDDLVHQRMDDPRIVLAIGKVNYIASSVAQQTKDKIELTMVLFDDILVLFYLRNNSMHFYNSNMISSVIPLKTMIVREMERGTNEIMLLCTDKEKPDLYHLSFPSKSELRNWVTQIHSAKASAVAVRYAPGRRSQVTLQKHEEFNEEPHNSKIQEWQESLQILFDERKQKEELLRDYMVGRMKFFDEVRAHFKKFPIRSITASTSTLPVAGSLIERRETRDLEKIKNFVQQKFLELRETRRSGLDSLVERAEKARDYDLQSFFDDLHDLTIAISSSSESSGTDGGVETSTTSNSEDEPTSSSPLSSKGKKPRRVRTYHGSTADSSQPRGGTKEGSLRRHTTVPKLGESGVIRSDEDDEEEQIDESLRKLPLSMPNRARKAATALICENVNLRIENNKLKSENALQEMHISSLKSRKTAGIETEEKLESLRQKQEDIQARERKLKQDQENFKDEMRRKADDLDAREEKMKRREAEIESRMQYTQATFRSGSCVFQENEHHHPPPTPSIPTTSPTILSLAAKTQVKPKHRK